MDRVTGMTTDKLVAVLQDRDSSAYQRQNGNKTISNYLNIVRSSNELRLMEYFHTCFMELSKFTYMRIHTMQY